MNSTIDSPKYQGEKDPFTRSLAGEVLTQEELTENLTLYQASIAAKTALEDASPKERARLARTISRGESALKMLLSSTYRLAIKQANDLVRSRYGTGSPDIYEEARAEAYLGLIEALNSYTPDQGGSILGYISLVVTHRVRASLRAGAPESWTRVASMAARAEATLYSKLQRTPTDAELTDEVRSYAIEWAQDKLANADELNGPSRHTDESSTESARKKLVRQGTWAAIENLSRVRNLTQRPLSLDQKTDDSGSLLDILVDTPGPDSSLLESFLASLPADELEIVTRRFGLDNAPSETFEQIGADLGYAWPEVRQRLTRALSRLSAPHAQYAALSEDISSQFTESEQSPAQRLVRRRSSVKKENA